MADVTFDQFLEEQKKTTSSVNRLGKTLREQLLGDKKGEKDERRVAAGNKAWQTRQTNIAEAGKKVGETTAVVDEKQTSFLERMLDKLNFLGKGTESAAQKKEGKKDEQSFLGKTFGKLGDTFKDGFKGMMGILGKFKTTAMTGLMAFLTAAGLFALIEFLQSKHWKKIREWIKKNPLEGVMIALVAVAAFFNPLKTLKVIRTLIGNVVLYVKNISKFFLWLGKILGKGILGSFKLMGKFVKVVAVSLEGYGKLFKKINAGFAKVGRGFTAVVKWVRGAGAWFANIGKTFKTWTTTGTKITKALKAPLRWIVDIFKWITNIGGKFARFGGGLARFAGPLGVIVSIGAALWETIQAMVARFKETGSIIETLETGIATFIGEFLGFIPNMIKSAVSWVFGKLGDIFGIEAFKDFSAFLDEIDIAELITDAIELVIDKIKETFSGLWGMIKSIAPDWLKKMMGIEASPEEQQETKLQEEEEKRTERIKQLQSDLESGDVEGFNTEANIKKARDELKKLKEEEQAAKNLNKYTADMDRSKPRSLEEVQRGLDLFGEMKGKGSEEQQGMVLKQMQLLEKRKAELEAAKGGGGGSTTNIAQDNSNKTNQSQTTHTSKRVVDPEMSQVAAANP